MQVTYKASNIISEHVGQRHVRCTGGTHPLVVLHSFIKQLAVATQNCQLHLGLCHGVNAVIWLKVSAAHAAATVLVVSSGNSTKPTSYCRMPVVQSPFLVLVLQFKQKLQSMKAVSVFYR